MSGDHWYTSLNRIKRTLIDASVSLLVFIFFHREIPYLFSVRRSVIGCPRDTCETVGVRGNAKWGKRAMMILVHSNGYSLLVVCST